MVVASGKDDVSDGARALAMAWNSSSGTRIVSFPTPSETTKSISDPAGKKTSPPSVRAVPDIVTSADAVRGRRNPTYPSGEPSATICSLLLKFTDVREISAPPRTACSLEKLPLLICR